MKKQASDYRLVPRSGGRGRMKKAEYNAKTAQPLRLRRWGAGLVLVGVSRSLF
jgi:hypothetical protein